MGHEIDVTILKRLKEALDDEFPFPEVGELVIGTVSRIEPYGAYMTLDEYNDAEGLLHISEISSRWVKNIRDHVRVHQKTVLKVLRIDIGKQHINLSLRRVTDRDKRERLLQWKRDRRGRALFNMAAQELDVDLETAYEHVGIPLQSRFGSLYEAFEQAVTQGQTSLLKAKIPSEWAETLFRIAQSRIRIPVKTIKGILEVTCSNPDGVEVLRGAFKKAQQVTKRKNANVRIFVVGAPRYQIEVTADTYKQAERILDRAVSVALKRVEAAGGVGQFIRSK